MNNSAGPHVMVPAHLIMKRNNKYYIRKSHRYLGLIIGIQFILWTVSGLYFSWTDIDEIHGDHFLKPRQHIAFDGLLGVNQLDSSLSVSSLALRHIGDEPYYWVNNNKLIHARTGETKDSVRKEEALIIADTYVADTYQPATVKYLTEVDKHHEYRERPLPAWMITYKGSHGLASFVSARDASFQQVRHRDWRWFDFLWMTHTMDYESRDNINNWALRIFSIFGLITVVSGFVLYFVSSPTMRRIKKGKR